MFSELERIGKEAVMTYTSVLFGNSETSTYECEALTARAVRRV